MDAEKIRLAEIIDGWVLGLARHSDSQDQVDELILENMIDFMDPFKQLLDTCTKLEMNLLLQKYDGFYRFANLLERLVQAMQDGVIAPPEGASMPPGWKQSSRKPKKKRPSKPKTKTKNSSHQHKQQIRRPISFLPTYTEMIIGEIAHTEEQYATFASVRSKPHVLDDEMVDRAIHLYEEQLTFIPLHEQQFSWWLSETISEAQRYQIEDLQSKLPLLREKTQALLDLLAELKQGTIDRILEMDDGELGLKFLRGELGRLD